MATTKKKAVSQSAAAKKTEQTINLNLNLKLSKETMDAISVDGKPSVDKFVERIGDTEAICYTDLDLSTVKVKMKDGKEHTMLKNGETLTEIGGDDDIAGVVDAIKGADLALFLQLVANSISEEYADDESEHIFTLA